MTPQVFISGMHIADDGTLVIHANEMAEAGVKSIELIEGTPEGRIAELEAQIRDAGDYAERLQIECSELKARAEAAEKRSATLTVQLSEEYRDWMKEQCNEECRYGERLYAEKYDEAKRLRGALEPVVRLMVSMQSLGYFTNDEWQSQLMTAQAALAAEQSDDEKGEYSCGYNTVSGTFHKPGCTGECGITNPGEAVEQRRIQRRRNKPTGGKEKGNNQ